MEKVYNNNYFPNVTFRQLMKEKQKEERKKRKKQKKTPRSTKFITAAQKLLEKVSSSEESDGSDVIIKGSLSARSQYPKLIDTVLQVRLF